MTFTNIVMLSHCNYKTTFHQSKYDLTEEQVSDYNEVFILFDKDQDGVLSITELRNVSGHLARGLRVRLSVLISLTSANLLRL